jgi:hypothetical protein
VAVAETKPAKAAASDDPFASAKLGAGVSSIPASHRAPGVLEARRLPRPAPAARVEAPKAAPKVKSKEDVLFESAEVLLSQQEKPADKQELSNIYKSKSVGGGESQYTGEPISLDLKDADIKDVFRTISQLTQLNIVVDPEVKGTVTVQLEDVPWDQALDLILKQNSLGYVLENNIMRIATTAKLQAEQADRARLMDARQAAEPTRTVIKKLSYAKAGELTATVKSVMSRRGDIVVDSRTNTLIIREIPTYLPAVLQLIENLDTATPQVMIEARIVETTKSLGRSLGISWGANGAADVAHGNTTNLIFPNNITGNFNVPRQRAAGQHPGHLHPRRRSLGGGKPGAPQDHLVAEGRGPDQHGGLDPVGRPDPGPNERQQHDDRHLRGRDAQADGDAADHQRGDGPPDRQRLEAGTGRGPEPVGRPERSADGARVQGRDPRARRRHERHRRHFPDQRPGPEQHDPRNLEDSDPGGPFPQQDSNREAR